MFSKESIVVLSGTFSRDRNDLEKDILDNGYRLSNVLTKQSILCIGSNSKTFQRQEAALLGVPTVGETFLDELLLNSRKGKSVPFDNYLIVNKENRRESKRRLDESEWDTSMKKKRKASGISKGLFRKVIAFEGEIGAGKSTLSRAIQTAFPEQTSVYEEQTNQDFLKLFYGNPGKYGFAFQWGMLKTRIYQLRLAQHDSSLQNENKFYLWDRSMIGDYIFALWNHLLGSISTEEMEVYESEFGGSLNTLEDIPFLQNIHCFAFLNDEPAACKARVEQHRKNESEQGIPLDYYEGIDDIHFSIFLTMMSTQACKTVVLNWKDYDDPPTVVKRLGKVIAGQIPSASVKFVNSPPKRKKGRVMYQTEEDILSAYQQIQSGDTDNLLEDVTEVVVSMDVMQVSPEEKGVNSEHLSRYAKRIFFYRNEFKRVVCWHLGKGHPLILAH